MEAILDDIGWQASLKPPPVATTKALLALADALRGVLPLLTVKLKLTSRDGLINGETATGTPATTTSTPALTSARASTTNIASSSTNAASPDKKKISAAWLVQQLQNSLPPTELDPAYLAQQVWEASRMSDPARQQAALFDVLGASNEAMEFMFTEIAPNLSKIALISAQEFNENTHTDTTATTSTEVTVDLEEERRRFLLHEAQETAQMAALAQAQLDAMESIHSPTAGTHTVARASEKKLLKWVEKAHKKAAVALARAKEAGAIVDEADLLRINATGPGTGGLLQASPETMYALQSSLLPEGSRHYYDKRGLPVDTIMESTDEYEKAIIPPAHRDVTKLPQRLVLTEIMTPIERVAFKGTTSLNPMQSAVFERAFTTRDNLLICAPTGAGKTNVALLTVVAHFRDVGLLPAQKTSSDTNGRIVDTGRKVIYIAPMKALAQEVVDKFSEKLKPLGLIVRELTGDMQLTRAEAESANVIVTTPEKWDVVTRKSGTDENSLGNQCGLLIIDEVHLLADERGAVIESVVSRLHRLVESRQRQTRIVGLSATLPNYEDVAEFLQVPDRGLFYFGPEHRPVPLQQTIIGIHTQNSRDRYQKELKMNQQCYEIVVDSLRRGYQVMVFVHSRKGTGDTALALADLAAADGTLEACFVTQGKDGPSGDAHNKYSDRAKKSRNRELSNHFANGMGIHHAGMLRGDRKLTEQMFSDGAIKVLCCTATLAWGINLPAHTVVIKGTEVYNPEKGKAADLSILDVQQIFGRAGRPQFDSSGEATMITTADAYTRYMDKLVRAVPIESNFIKQLDDHLNAEIVGGTVTTIAEASNWLKYTYLYIRMLRNPLAYGISGDEKADDPFLGRRCQELVTDAATRLATNRMINFDRTSGNLSVLNHGRVAAHYYVQSESVQTFNEKLNSLMTDAQVLAVIASAMEFRSMKVRQEEMDELGSLLASACPIKIQGAGLDDAGHGLITGPEDKAFVLIQAFIGRAKVKSFTLISDMNYVASNAGRVAGAIYEMCLKMNEMAGPALKLIRFAKSIDSQIWWFQTPLRHFPEELNESHFSAIETRLGGRKHLSSFDAALSLLDLQPKEVGDIARWVKGGSKVQSLVRMLPNVDIDCKVQPVTYSVLRFQIKFTPTFEWNGRWHGGAQSFWAWVENGDTGKMYHFENVLFSRRTFPEPVDLDILLPAFNPMPSHYIVKFVSDSWVGCELSHSVSLTSLKMPQNKTPYTELQDLTPLPITALQEPTYQQLYKKFDTFNPVQTQLFHVLYHTDTPIFLGAPTGSGKTAVAELAILRMKRIFPKGICVYIAPLKSLARERLKEWQKRLGVKPLGWRVLELSGDTSYDQGILEKADILICTPEKWDLVSRGWRGVADSISGTGAVDGKAFVRRVKLLVLDEVHLLGEERGAVLEAIVSRTRYISRVVENESGGQSKGAGATRIIGLSTALENPLDLADWIGIDTTSQKPTARRGMYNFRPSVRPVPVIAYVQGYSGRHYCPRMATMNKPCFAAIKQYSPDQPALIFVASRRQTRLTAVDLISYAAAEEDPKKFLGCSEAKIEALAESLHDDALKHTITFGIGIHHAGLSSHDRDTVETLYLSGDIRVLVATATLAWGVNLPAHLVIVKGTEYYDGKTSRYVDYPLTDVLQMMGRAGRPGFDDKGFAVIMCLEDKKDFYKKFLYVPFPLESRLNDRMCENLNAEIASGTVGSVQEAVGYLTWTFFARRMKSNPSYYGATSGSDEDVDLTLLSVVKETLSKLKASGCVDHDEKDLTATLNPTPLGIASCIYYLQHETPRQMQFGVRECRKIVNNQLEIEPQPDLERRVGSKPLDRFMRLEEISLAWLLYTVCNTHEFDELPVRHNEEILNEELSDTLRWGPDTQYLLTGRESYRSPDIFSDPHTKAFLLVQAYLEKAQLPISDFVNDTKSVIENVPRLLAAMEYIASSDITAAGSFELLTQFVRARQYIETRSVPSSDPLEQLGISKHIIQSLADGAKSKKDATRNIAQLRALARNEASSLLNKLNRSKAAKTSIDLALDHLYALPSINVGETKISNELHKTTGKIIGKLKISIDFERTRVESNSQREISLMILLGTFTQRILLGRTSLRLSRTGKWNVSKEVSFDWNAANADGGEGGGKIIVRLMMNQIRGFDLETSVPLH